MAPKKRQPTIARGAVIERAYLYRWIARQLREPGHTEGYRRAVRVLRNWLKAQPSRTKKPGGIGR
jgi:hypothetical protein